MIEKKKGMGVAPCPNTLQCTELIADEATSTIWRCWDPQRNRIVVVKVPKPNSQQTRREAMVLPLLSHPNVVSMLGTVSTSHGPALLLEPATSDLLAFVHGPMSEEVVRHIARGLLRALAYVHGRGIIHRDVKLENILVATKSIDDESGVILADFGAARPCRGWVEGDCAGSYPYWAPEVWVRRRYSASADLWAAGVVIYTCLTGRLPTHHGSLEEMRMAVLLGLPGIFDEADAAHVSEPARRLIGLLLSVDPAARPAAAEALASDWLGAGDIGAVADGPSGEGDRDRPASPPDRSGTGLVAAL